MAGIGTRLEMSGVNEMKQKAGQAGKNFIRSAIKAVFNFERTEMKEMEKRTPVETGELVESSYIGEPVIKENVIRATMGFLAPHADIVHEDLEAFHPRGQAKYMESVLNESGPHFLERVATDIKSDLGL